MRTPRKFNLSKAYNSDYVYILRLKPCGARDQQMRSVAKASATVFNRTLEIQLMRFHQGAATPLRSIDLHFELEAWKQEPGMGYLSNAPKIVLNKSITDACRKVAEAFEGKQEYKFPLPITNGYKHFEFNKGVKFSPTTKRLKLPGFDDPFAYDMLYHDPVTKGDIVGDLKRCWVIRHKDQWILLLWTRAKLLGCIGAVPVSIAASKKRLRLLDEYLYDESHWIVVAHKQREANLIGDAK